MKKLRYTSISTRISSLLGLIIIITMSVFSAISLMKQQKDSVDSLSRSTLLLSQTTERILRLSMLKNRREEISMAIKNIVGKDGIQSVRILNHDGVIKFSSRKTEIDEHISRTDQLCTNCHTTNGDASIRPVSSFYNYHFDEEHEVMYSSLPIYNSPGCFDGDCHATASQQAFVETGKSEAGLHPHPVHDSTQTILGFIEIQVSARQIISDLAKSRAELIAMTFLIALMASGVAYFFIRHLVGNPVKILVDGTRRVAQGDFNHEIPAGTAELGVLAEAFNQMQRQLLSTQSQLIESEKLASVGELANEIANEINNPLTGIIVYAESLIEQSAAGGKARADYETILQEALKIRSSVRNVLSLTKQEKPNFVSVDVSEIVRHAISVLEKFSNFRNIKIITGIQKSIPNVSGDAGLLEQVFLDLLLISSENMPSGGIVNISVAFAEKEKEIEIRFTDTGRAISENVLRALSGQSGNRTFENLERTGVGLAVCKDIIDLHRGTINAGSNSGAGTTITIRLPA